MPCREEEIEALIKQEGLLQDYATSRRQMEFISTWQKLIDVNGSNVEGMVQNAFNTFMNHFSLDCVHCISITMKMVPMYFITIPNVR